MALGENLKRLRRDKHWTQGDLAEASGVKVGHISKLERNESDPKISTIYKLINALGCSPNALLSDVSETNLDGLVAMAFERAQQLPEEEKSTLLDLIDKYCLAVSMQAILSDERGRFLGNQLVSGATEPLVKKKEPSQ